MYICIYTYIRVCIGIPVCDNSTACQAVRIGVAIFIPVIRVGVCVCT